jgi:hypothetical protein
MNRPMSKQNPLSKLEILGGIILKDIREYRQYAIENDLLDTQEFINFMDELNKLSIDPDRQ